MKSILIDRLHRTLSESKIIVSISKKIRNQANAVIRMSLQNGLNMDSNGEGNLIKAIAPSSGVVIDVGANVGAWIYRFLECAPLDCRAIAFEPVPETAMILKRNKPIALSDRIIIKEMAVSDNTGNFTFFCGKECRRVFLFCSRPRSRWD